MASDPQDMSINPSYLTAIKGFEGFTPEAKWDYAQYSNGYGTVAQHPGEVISVEEADRRFRGEIGKAYEIVQRFAPNVDDGTKAALTSLTYNAGTAWLKSGLGSAIRSGDLDRARELFVQYVRAGNEVLPGLVARREAEVTWIGSQEIKQAGTPATDPSRVRTEQLTARETNNVAAIQQTLSSTVATASQNSSQFQTIGHSGPKNTAALEGLAVASLREAQIAMMAFDASERLRDAERANEKDDTRHWTDQHVQ